MKPVLSEYGLFYFMSEIVPDPDYIIMTFSEQDSVWRKKSLMHAGTHAPNH